MRTLVTGGAGFIGSTLVDRLLAEGHSIDVVDDLSSGSLANLAEARASAHHDLTFHQLDVRSPELVELMARRRPEVVFHLAAQADVRVSVERPVFDAEVNIIGTLRVLEGARAAGSARVVFAASGGTLYGDVDATDLPVRESHPQRPLSPYGVSKKSGIDYLTAYRELHAVEYCALALANVYGPRQDPHGEAGVVAIFFGKLVAGETPLVFGDGSQTRDYVYVGDVVEANLAALAYAGPQPVFNIGTAAETSVNDLLAECQRAAGTDVAPELRPPRLGELSRSALDVSLAGRELGWKATTPLAEGLSETLRSIAG
jgi:UDP-glucose 4-epimerase